MLSFLVAKAKSKIQWVIVLVLREKKKKIRVVIRKGKPFPGAASSRRHYGVSPLRRLKNDVGKSLSEPGCSRAPWTDRTDSQGGASPQLIPRTQQLPA